MDDIQAYVEHAQQKPATTPSVVPEAQHGQTNGAGKSASLLSAMQESKDVTEERQPLTGLRKRIAEHMERSWRTIPHATAFDELDGSELVALRQVLKPLASQRGVRLTYMPLLIKLLLPVLKEFPIFNASLDEERREIIYKRVYHIGIAARFA